MDATDVKGKIMEDPKKLIEGYNKIGVPKTSEECKMMM
jgi:hypothetical protein